MGDSIPKPQFEGADWKKRKCLGKCGREFYSEWKGERICPTCKGQDWWRSTPDMEVVR